MKDMDLVVQFAILWGRKIGEGCHFTSQDKEIADELKQWDSIELLNLFTAWKDEYLAQNKVEDSCDFFEIKLTDLLHE